MIRSSRWRAAAACARLAAIAFVATAGLVTFPIAIPAASTPVAAHSGLVAVVPLDGGGGDLRLVFSEPLEARFSGTDLVTAQGLVVRADVGRIDPSDPHVMLVAAPASGGEGLSVAWRALSAADGHVTSGAFPLPSTGQPGAGGGPGTPTRGHSPGHLSLEALAKVMAFGGLLVALGLLLFGRFVVAPVLGAVPRGMVITQAAALGIAAIGGFLLLLVTELELAAAGTVVDPFAYVAGNRVGALLALRGVVPLTGGVVAAVLIRQGAVRRASEVAASIALVTLVLTALSGHAAAYASPVPVAVDLVHLTAASVWLGGLIGLAGMIGGPTPPSAVAVRAMIPRFSGLAVTAIALLGLTGLYAAWLETEDWTSVASPYSLVLAVKVLIVGAAFAVGAVNYLDAGRDLPIGGGLIRRITIEAGLAAVVVVAAASLTSADPPSLTRAIPIASAGTDRLVSLSLAPGRAGPNLAIVSGPVPVGATLELTPLGGEGEPAAAPEPLALGPLDLVPGAAAAQARSQTGGHVGVTTSIPPGRWDAAIVVGAAGGTIARFDFGLDGSGITEGRQAPPIPPPLLAAIGLLIGALLGAALLARGLAPPLVERRAGRASMAAFSVLGGVLGVAILTIGPRL